MNCGGYFDPDNIKKKIVELESIVQEDGFWNDKKRSESIISEMNGLKEKLEKASYLKEKIDNNVEMLNSLKNLIVHTEISVFLELTNIMGYYFGH